MARSRLTDQEIALGAEGIELVCDECGGDAVAVYKDVGDAYAVCEEHETDPEVVSEYASRVLDLR